MTDSNLKTNEDNPTSNVQFTELEPVDNKNKQTKGFVNFDANINTENIINSFYIDDIEFDFYKDDTFDPSKAAFNSAFSENIDFVSADLNNSELSVANQNILNPKRPEVTDKTLKYLGVYQFIKTQKKPRTRIKLDNIFKELTGYSFDDAIESRIPRKVVESEKFQKGLNAFYIQNKDNITIPEKSNLSPFTNQLQSFGYEVSGGVGLGIATAPMLQAGWPGIALYAITNGVGNYLLNEEAQKIRKGQLANIGKEGKTSEGEKIAALIVGAIPFATEAKGLQGIRNAALQGGATTTAETTIRTLIEENRLPNAEETITALSIGTLFGGAFKGSLDFFSDLIAKYAGKSAAQIDADLSNTDKKKVNKMIKDLEKIKKKEEKKLNEKVARVDNAFDQNNFNIQDTRGKNVFYHGASQEFTLNESDTFGRGVENLYGDGLYVTDDLVTSVKYKKKNKIKGQETEGVVYEITEKQPVKFFDLDAPASPEKIEQIKRIFSFDDDDYADIIDRVLDDVGPNPSIGKIYDEIKLYSNRRGLSAATTSDIFSSFTEELQREGFGGFIHQGGNLAGKGKRLHKVKIYFDPANQVDIKKVDLDQFRTKTQTQTNNQTEKLGDPNFTPNQYTNKGIKSENIGLIKELIRLKKLKNEKGTSPVKTEYATQLGGLNLFDDGVIDLSKTEYIQELTRIYGLINDIAPSEDLAVALTQTVVLATDGVVDANIKYVNALNSKDFTKIENAINDLDEAFNQVNKFLTLSLPGSTTWGRVGKALQIEAPSGIAGKSVEEVMNMSGAERRIAAESIGETTISLDKQKDAISNLKKELTKALAEAKKTNDFTKLYKVANKIQQAEGDPQKIVAFEKHQILPSLVNKTARVVNEIGINALMSAPGTNEVNLIGGILNTYYNAFKLVKGSRDRDGAEAALRHVLALHSNFQFARKVWKKSWDMEDNLVNMGNSKIALNPEDKFQLSTTNTDWASRVAFNWTGKAIRLPSRLMTSNDALIQAPNLMAYANMKFFLHGKNKLGYEGDKLNKYINDSSNTIIEYFLSNGKAEIDDKIIARILKESQEFSKSITFTNNIRTDSLFGMGANEVNQWASNPIARLYLTFVRTPANLMSEGFKITPLIGTPFPTNTDNKFLNVAGEVGNVVTLNKFLADEVRVDLLSPDPLIAQRARGGMDIAQGLGLTIGGLSFYYGNKFLEEDYVPDTILTGGGPDWTTKEGKAMWINMVKNGWQPYSVGKLQYNEDGSPKFKNGEPVYRYSSYDNTGFDPFAQAVGMMVDFVNSTGLIKGKPYDEFTVGWAGVVGRNIFNKSYTKQVNELMRLIAEAPSLVDDTGENPLQNYKSDKAKKFIADQTVSRLIPYSNLLARFKRIPDDILQLIGGYSREEMLKDRDLSRYIQKRDEKVRPGDLIDKNIPIEDEAFNDKQLLKELWAYLNIAIHKKTPGYDGNLPLMREHITNEPIVHPYKEGPFGLGTNLFALRKHKTSKNYKIYLALKQIGRILPEPKDIITAGYSKNNIEGKKLDTTEYAQLREFINTHIPQGKKYGNVNLLKAVNNYLDSTTYKGLSSIVEKEGLTSEKGQMAAKKIYSELYKINNYYIKSGEGEFFLQVMGEKEILKRLEKKAKIKADFNNQLEKELVP